MKFPEKYGNPRAIRDESLKLKMTIAIEDAITSCKMKTNKMLNSCKLMLKWVGDYALNK